jgi:hypothetical protein
VENSQRGLGDVEREIREQEDYLGDLRGNADRTKLDFAFNLAALIYGVDRAQMCETNRSSRKMTDARQVAMYLANVALAVSYEQIGVYSNRNRATIRHGIERVEDRRDNPAFDELITSLEVLLSGLMKESVNQALDEGVKVDFSISPFSESVSCSDDIWE